MNIPKDEILTVVTYRDFHDVPRLILAVDGRLDFWILDGGFDDVLDEYAPASSVHPAGRERREALSTFERHAAGDVTASVQAIPASDLAFDATMRHHFRNLASGENGDPEDA